MQTLAFLGALISGLHGDIASLQREQNCLAEAIYFEARGDGATESERIRAMSAVGHVILNRVNTKGYPGTICGVVQQVTGDTYQFSYHLNGQRKYEDSDSLLLARTVAAGVMLGNIPDPTNGSIAYHANYVTPINWPASWRRQIKIGSHIFYRGTGRPKTIPYPPSEKPKI